MYKPSKLAGIILAAGLGINLYGCRDSSQDFHKEGTYQGYKVEIWRDGSGRKINIYDANSVLSAIDYLPKYPDGRFDVIKLYIGKGSPLEQFASLDAIEEIYKSVKQSSEESE